MGTCRIKWGNVGMAVLTVVTVTVMVIALAKRGDRNAERCGGIVVSVVDKGELQFVDEEVIRGMIMKKFPKMVGARFSEINLREVEALLLETGGKRGMTTGEAGAISRAECYRMPSGKVGVKVWQRHPVMRVWGTENYYVDGEGRTFDLSDKFTAYVPIISGDVRDKKWITGPLRVMMKGISEDKFWSAEIQEVRVIDRKKVELIPTVGDHVIVMGEITDWREKLDKLEKFYKYGLMKIGWGDYKEVNVEYKEQVICVKN